MVHPSGWSGKFGSIVCYPYLFEFDCRWYMKENKTHSYVFWCKHSKGRKAREKRKKAVMFLRKLGPIMTCHHDMTAPLRRWGFLFFLINPSLIPLFCALCSTAKFCYFSDWLKFYENLGQVPQHGSQWRHFTFFQNILQYFLLGNRLGIDKSV